MTEAVVAAAHGSNNCCCCWMPVHLGSSRSLCCRPHCCC
jgi:hypothetical protein